MLSKQTISQDTKKESFFSAQSCIVESCWLIFSFTFPINDATLHNNRRSRIAKLMRKKKKKEKGREIVWLYGNVIQTFVEEGNCGIR